MRWILNKILIRILIPLQSSRHQGNETDQIQKLSALAEYVPIRAAVRAVGGHLSRLLSGLLLSEAGRLDLYAARVHLRNYLHGQSF